MTLFEKTNNPTSLAISSSDFRALEKKYTYRNKESVQQFLNIHPDLIPFLMESYSHLQKYFGNEAKFFLEIVSDPEASDILEELFVVIRPEMSVEDALSQLDQLDRNWYFDNLYWLGSILNFSLEIE